MYLNILGQPMVVLGSTDVILEMLERRAAVTSGRPVTPSVSL